MTVKNVARMNAPVRDQMTLILSRETTVMTFIRSENKTETETTETEQIQSASQSCV